MEIESHDNWATSSTEEDHVIWSKLWMEPVLKLPCQLFQTMPFNGWSVYLFIIELFLE